MAEPTLGPLKMNRPAFIRLLHQQAIGQARHTDALSPFHPVRDGIVTGLVKERRVAAGHEEASGK
ncbi:MAG TPA: hypothetical protein VKG80_05705 [Trebonia sp.]|nr:hypothetical protein [Trebonia sp.]